MVGQRGLVDEGDLVGQRGLVDEGDLVGQRGLVDLRVEGGGCRRGRVIGPSSFGGGPSRVGRPKRVWVPSRVGRPRRVCGVEQAELVNQRGFVGWTRQR